MSRFQQQKIMRRAKKQESMPHLQGKKIDKNLKENIQKELIMLMVSHLKDIFLMKILGILL